MWVIVPVLNVPFSMDVAVMFLTIQMSLIEVTYNFSLLHNLHTRLTDTFLHTKKY